MKKFVINLKRRPDRLKQFQERCPYTDVEVVYGFDGKNIKDESKKEIKFFNKFKMDQKIQYGAMGCTISHIRIWKKIIDQNLPMAMIFEDDTHFNENFKEKMETIVFPEDGIIYFGGRFTKDFMIPKEYSLKINENINQSNVSNWNAMLHERTTHGYIITLKIAKLLLLLIDFSKDFFEIDKFMIQKLKEILPIYNTIPLLCWSPMGGNSDIRN